MEIKETFKAILLDCNGIIIDDEPIHLRLFQKVLKEEGIALTKKEYFKRYLAMDDRSCFESALKRHKRPHNQKIIQSLVSRKAVYYKKTIGKEARFFPGVLDFIKNHSGLFAIGVVSGALRHEIRWILKRGGVHKLIRTIIGSEDVQRGKPDPQGYKKGLKALNRLPRFKNKPLKPRECLAIEDSIHGVQAAKQARLKCLAVTNSYPRKKLFEADRVVSSLKFVKLRHA